MMEVKAYAKLNLTLDVLGKRADGYHDLKMVMQTVTLADTLTLTRTGTGMRVKTNLRFLPDDQRNLAAVAARCFGQYTGLDVTPLFIEIHKRIPVCAGMAGGSSDAAAVIHGLNAMTDAGLSLAQLQEIGGQVGSDVPYCLLGGTALAEGRGEVLTRLPPLPQCHLVLCKPSFAVSTPDLFGAIDCRRIRRRPDTDGLLAALEVGSVVEVARRLYNVFEDVLPLRRQEEISAIKNSMISAGALGSAMSGTGPTVYGIFQEETAARNAFQRLSEEYDDTFLAKPV